VLKGFGKNYFRLVAIQAATANVILHAQHVRTHNRHDITTFEADDDEQSDPPTDTTILLDTKICCNTFFKRRAIEHLKNYFYPLFRRTIYKHTKSTLSPPL